MTTSAGGPGPGAGLAIGLDLTLVRTEDGGRRTPVLDLPGHGWSYRPNWGLPTMTAPEQTGAPVLGFSRPEVHPGGRARAVIVTPHPSLLDRWRDEVHPGVVLPMYEGTRVCGHGTVLWIVDVTLPMTDAEESRCRDWLASRHTGGSARESSD